MSNIELKLEKTLSFIERFIKMNGYAPSVREICTALEIKSTATCYYYLQKLQDKGLIKQDGSKKRAITLPSTKSEYAKFLSVPVLGTITAGQPIFAVENLEEYCPLPLEFGDSDELFMLKVRGNSMIEKGIFNGDKIIVKKQSTADSGQIVVAYFDESATVKTFFKQKDHIILHPENSTMTDIILKDVTILGIVKGLLRKF